MSIRNTTSLAALVTAAALSATPSSAATLASATTALNIRSGPGPQYPVVGVIKDHGRAVIRGCIQGSLWCQVNYSGKQGWAYSKYLTMEVAGRPMVLSEYRTQVPVISHSAPVATVGSAAPVPAPQVTGTLVESDAAPPLAIMPPPQVRTYVIGNPMQPVYLNGEVVVGAGLPSTVTLKPVPDYDYDYAYVNRQPVLVQPSTRRIVYVYR